jgi:hypothetical protein
LTDENDQIVPHARGVNPLAGSEEEIASVINTFSTVHKIDGSDEIVSVIEGLCILMYQTIRSESTLDLIVALLAYMKGHFNQSICKVVCDGFEKIEIEESVEPHGWTAADIKQKWTLLKTNTIFAKVGYLISAVLSLSVCKINGVEWEFNKFKMFTLPCIEEQLSAVSLIDALVDVFEWTSTVGYKIFTTGSYDCLFFSDNRLQDFDNDYLFCLTKADYILNGNSDELGSFEKKVDNCIEVAAHLRKTKANASLNIWLTERLANLLNYKERIISKRRNTAIRFRPLGVGLTGASGVGKSTLAKIVMKTCLLAMDFEYDTDRIITKDMFDKYDSTYTSDILGVFLDDLGNGKAQFVITSPTDIIIKFFNNMAAQAVKAEIQSKGLVYIDFKVGVITSNHNDYSVNYYTDIPEASLSRLVHTRVEVKPEYRKEGSLALDNAHEDLKNAKLTHDVWQLTIQESVVKRLTDVRVGHDFRTKVVELDGKQVKCENLDLKTYLRAMIEIARKHKASQYDVMARAKAYDVEAVCINCCLNCDMCDCEVFGTGDSLEKESLEEPEPVVPHSENLFADMAKEVVTNSFKSYFNGMMGPYNSLKWWFGWSPIRSLTTRKLSHEISQVAMNTTVPFVMAITPSWMFNTWGFKYVVNKWEKSVVWYDFRHWSRGFMATGLLGVGTAIYKDRKDWAVLACAGTYCSLFIMHGHYLARVRSLHTEFVQRKDLIRTTIVPESSSKVKKGAAALAAVILSLKAMRMYLQSCVEPNGLNDDDKPGWFGYFTGMGMQVNTQKKSAHATTKQLIQKLGRNVTMIDVTRDDGTKTRCNAFFPRKGVMWIPKHVFYPGSDLRNTMCEHIDVKIDRGTGVGGRFEQKIAASMCVFTELDLVVVNVSKSPDFSTVTDWLPTSLPKGSANAVLVVRKSDGLDEDAISINYKQTKHSSAEFYGGEYVSALAVVGACMGPVLHDGKNPTIVGFHIGGSEQRKGVMQTVTLEAHERWMHMLEAIPGNFVGAESSEIPEQIMGKTVISGPVHPHAEASRLPIDASVVPIASTPLRATQKSSVVKSVLSDTVADVFGVESQWGPPKLMPNWKPFNAALHHFMSPSDTFYPDLVEKCRQDWLKPLLELVGTVPDTRVLTMKEAIMGIPGERFVDPMNMATSMCHPVYRKKRDYFTDIFDDKGVLTDRIPHPLIVEELDRVTDCYRRGKRANVIWSSSLKDEPTAYTKESVRVFQGSPIVLTLLMRKYFLKLARFLGMNSLEAECAVGVNAFGPEWQELMKHAMKYSKSGKNILGWDYSKYDLKMSSQMTIAAYLSLIELGAAHGYAEEDLKVMRMMVYDIVHPLLDYNGTLLQTFNMNTSGNSLTVFVNSIVGSLYVRMGFFSLFPDEDFRACIAAMTYGDDFIGSVKTGYEDFNFLTYKHFLEKHGMKITHPDKKTEGAEFIEAGSADFLKRRSSYVDELGCEIGALTEDSIFKSLHANLKSKEAHPREVARSVIECAMHEWFAHGKEIYDARRQKMLEVCDIVELPVPAVECTFDERVQLWKEKYE